MKAFLARRLSLREKGHGNVAVLGSRYSANTLALREFLTRDGHARNKAPLATSQEKAPSAPPPRLRAPIVLAGLLALAAAAISYFRFL